jgi:predicted ATP-grasp superfamily ATP-dependent carboligase
MQTLMMLGASERHVPFIKRAVEMGLFVICVDENPEAPGFNYCDAKEIISIRGQDKYVRDKAERWGIDACISIPDIGLRTAAYINTSLNLRGLKLHTYNIVTNKHFARFHYNDFGVKTPKAYFGDENDFPLIIKPYNSTGSQGILKLYTYSEYEHFISTCRHFNFVAEEYVEGTNVSVDLIMQNGKVKQYLVQDRYLEYDHCFVDSIIISPSYYYFDIDAPPLPTIAERACKAVGLTDGPANVQFIVDRNNKAHLIEINPRISGPYGVECHSYVTHAHWFNSIVETVLDIDLDSNKWCCIDYIQPNACITIGSDMRGIMDSIEYAPEVSTALEVWEWKKYGDSVSKMTAVSDSVAHIFIMGGDLDEVKERAYKILKNTKVSLGGS